MAGENSRRASSPGSLVTGVVLGSGAAWLLDARSGRRRRMQLRDAAVHAAHAARRAADRTSRDIGNRARGTLAAGRGMFQSSSAPDEVIAQRVRAQLGRVVSHPDAIEAHSIDGEVTLSGPVLRDEVSALLSRVRGVRGVRAVVDKLEVHEEAGKIPDLQPRSRRTNGPRSELLQEHWSPATRLALGSVGAALAGFGLIRRSWATPLAIAGTGMFLRAYCNTSFRKSLGIDREQRGIEIQKTTFIQAPVEQVYSFWAQPENLAQIMTHIKDVRKTNESYRWTLAGPGGVSVSWNSVITEQVPNQVIAWQSEPDSVIRNCGCVRFESANGGTRVHLRMFYNPVGGMLSHSLASFLGVDPKHVLDQDMVRMKSLFEKGTTTAHHHKVTREQLSA